jgi:hypothetical protein
MRMMAFALIAVLAGCGTTATTAVSVGSTAGGPVGPGTAVSGAQLSAYSQSSSAALPLLGLFVLGATIYNPAENDARMGGLARPTPPLDPGRPVNAQDCSQPISDWSANLKCK